MLTFVNLARKEGTNLREIALTGASLHMLFLAIDPKKRDIFKEYCEMGYVMSLSNDQMAFADVHHLELGQWQKHN